MNATVNTNGEPAVAHQNRSVEGMSCYDCAQTIERAASRIDGVVQCTVSFPAARMRLDYDPSHTEAPASVERVVRQLGYRLGPVLSQLVAPPATDVHDDDRPSWRRHTDTIVTAIAAAATFAAVLADALSDSNTAARILYAVAIVVGGFAIARAGVRALIATRRFDIKLLMTIAVVGAVAIARGWRRRSSSCCSRSASCSSAAPPIAAGASCRASSR